MSPQKPEPKGKTQPEKLADELELDAETVKDLEPGEESGARVRGGGYSAQACGGAQSDVRLKEAVRPFGDSLARLRRLRLG
jgi:hypothetical protein